MVTFPKDNKKHREGRRYGVPGLCSEHMGHWQRLSIRLEQISSPWRFHVQKYLVLIYKLFLRSNWNCGGASALAIQVCESGELALLNYLMHEQRASKDNGVLEVIDYEWFRKIHSRHRYCHAFKKADAFCYERLALEHCSMFILWFTYSNRNTASAATNVLVNPKHWTRMQKYLTYACTTLRNAEGISIDFSPARGPWVLKPHSKCFTWTMEFNII